MMVLLVVCAVVIAVGLGIALFGPPIFDDDPY